MKPPNVAERFKLPADAREARCPGCGLIYGHHGTAVCSDCAKCTTCCRSAFLRAHRLVTADDFMKAKLGKV